MNKMRNQDIFGFQVLSDGSPLCEDERIAREGKGCISIKSISYSANGELRTTYVEDRFGNTTNAGGHD